MPEARQYDLVLLGATGFTGQLVAAHLARRCGDLAWAIAGRDPDRLAGIAAELGEAAGARPPDIEVVDVTDREGLLALAGRTRVLATTVGPYARLGEPVVEACVRQGTHYADITGEPAFVSLLRDRYDTEAAERGVKVVTCCGFDSVPHDLGVRFTVGHLPDDVPLTVRGYVELNGRLSGGTAHSALEAAASRSIPRPDRDRTPDPRTQRRVAPLPARLHRIEQLGGWGVPMPTIDPVIVLRSARVLDGYGSAFRYGHFLRVRRLPTVVAGAGALGVAGALASVGPTRSLLERFLPDPGEGPDEQTRARSSFSVTFLARGGDTTITTRVSGGDPGYDETAKMLGEAALSLALDDGPATAGVLTPAVGLGAPYLARLQDQGLRFEVVPS
ncbi:MAG: saccharopine dehydrogenase [Nitriliruptor sp.]|nr:MAG: saccharopine dehydrogenase [Nitriliruptor sp.]